MSNFHELTTPPAAVVILDRVVVGLAPDLYARMTGSKAGRRAFRASVLDAPILRVGGDLLLLFGGTSSAVGRVVDTKPAAAGVADRNTSVVILQLEDNDHGDDLVADSDGIAPQSPIAPVNPSSAPRSPMKSPVVLADFLDRELYLADHDEAEAPADDSQVDRTGTAVQCGPLMAPVSTELPIDGATAGLATAAVLAELGVSSGSWAAIRVGACTGTVRLFVSTVGHREAGSSVLGANVWLPPAVLSRLVPILSAAAVWSEAVDATATPLNRDPPVAAAVEFVFCPSGGSRSGESGPADVIGAWFAAAPRLVWPGVVVSIPLPGSQPRWRWYAEDEVVTLQILRVECEDGAFDGGLREVLVEAATTKVIQRGGQARPSRISFGATFAVGWSAVCRPADLEPLIGSLFDVVAPCTHAAADPGLSCAVVMAGPPGAGKRTAALWIVSRLGLVVTEHNAFNLLQGGDKQSAAGLEAVFRDAAGLGSEPDGSAASPVVLLLRHVEALAIVPPGSDPSDLPLARALCQAVDRWCRGDGRLLLIATCGEASLSDLSSAVRRAFGHEIEVQAPDRRARRDILGRLLTAGAAKVNRVGSGLDLDRVAETTASFTPGALATAVAEAHFATVSRGLRARLQASGAAASGEGSSDGGGLGAQSFPLDDRDAALQFCGFGVSQADIDGAVSALQGTRSSALGVPTIPSVEWSDVGGLGAAKAEILDTIQLPLERPELFSAGLAARSGVLFFGPPGCGKTLLAKAVATECNLNFLSVKGPELINMYVGESERNVRQVFATARAARPCVIFFDELDSLAPNRGKGADSGGVMDRVVSQLLAELDGMQSSADVFVIGATNRPDLLDPALLRPGRFDRLVYLGVSASHAAQAKILRALTRRFQLDPSLDLLDVAEACPLNFTGADLYALCSDAALCAIKRRIAAAEAAAGRDPEAENSNDEDDQSVAGLEDKAPLVVRMVDFEEALTGLTPSVSVNDLAEYERLRAKYCPAGSPS